MKAIRINSNDPVKTASDMLNVGLKSGTILYVLTGTRTESEAIRNMLDLQSRDDVTVLYQSCLIETSIIRLIPTVQMIPWDPEVIKQMSNMICNRLDSPTKQQTIYKPARHGNVMMYHHEGEITTFALNKKMTEFTTDITQALIVSNTTMASMYREVGTRGCGIKVPKWFTVNEIKFSADDHFTWDDMYSDKQVMFDSDNVMYDTWNDFQSEMSKK